MILKIIGKIVCHAKLFSPKQKLTVLSILLICIIFVLSACNVLNPEPTPILPAQTSLPVQEEPTATPALLLEEEIQPESTQTLLSDEILSEKEDYQLPLPICFDLDEGVIVSDNDPDCDFSVRSPAGDENRLEVYPQGSALFAFTQIFWEQPALQECKNVQDWGGQAASLDTSLDYYICYETNQAHYGMLFVGEQSENFLQVNWKTWQESNPDFVFDLPEPTPTPLRRFLMKPF